MDTMTIVVLISTATFVVLLLIIGLPSLVSRNWKRHRAETVDRWAADDITFLKGPVGGKFIGVESIGSIRNTPGIGFVVLTDQDLRVTRASPSREWYIPYQQIKGVMLLTKFMDQFSKKTPFVVVRFIEDGHKDKLAFQVNEAVDWASDLAQAAGVKLKEQSTDDD